MEPESPLQDSQVPATCPYLEPVTGDQSRFEAPVYASEHDTFLRWGLVSTSPNPQDGGPPLVVCLLLLVKYIFCATFHIGGCSSNRILRTCHAVVTGTHLSWLYCILWWICYNKSLRKCIVNMYNKHHCFLSSWYFSFLGSSWRTNITHWTYCCKFYVLRALQLSRFKRYV
jgi:hypothetical protein